MLFTSKGTINLRNEKWKDDFSPLDDEGTSYVDREYSRAYVKHLFKAGEMLGPMIASIHNLAFYQWLVSEARKHLEEGDFTSWKSTMVKQLSVKL
jgi:queuine tRNA-ribosyltransferase